MSAKKVLLITGATGKQGGSLIDQIVNDAQASSQFSILAVTRDANSSSSKRLAEKSPSITLVQGNLDDCPALFAEAKKASSEPIWGVFSVQISMGKGVTQEGEIKQGNDLFDESVKAGVKHFVYSSVERGGEERSWENPTPVGHFQTKQKIELHIRDNAGDKIGWTILRPVGFFENLAPGMPSKVFVTALKNTVGTDKRLQYVSIVDIGFFAMQAFKSPQEWNHRALGLAGWQGTFNEMDKAFQNKTGAGAPQTFWFLGSVLTTLVSEVWHMLTFWRDEGYAADVDKCRKMNPKMLDFEQWLVQKSDFKTIA